ncbi:FtsX-like permease family protein [bacterium]|nr:FtsX-like permease family protein [bacterium]
MSILSLLKLSVRHTKGHPLQKLLLFLGIAIGVAVVVAIDLANESISRSFQLSTESITGKATHQIIGPRQGIDQLLYKKLRVDMGLRQIAPVISDYVKIRELDQKTVRILGIDPFAEPRFRNYLSSSTEFPDPSAIQTLLTKPNQILISQILATENKLKPGDTITLLTQNGQAKTIVAGILSSGNTFTQNALSSVLITDISTAQEILGMGDRIHYIDLIINPDDAKSLALIRSQLPQHIQVVASNTKSQAIRQMSHSFELNLKALSLLALLVGMFLIYNTITFSVVQRRVQLGTLRAIGVTKKEIFVLILGETFIWGLLGTTAGLLLGIVLGTGTVRMVSQTISDLYFTLTVNQFYVSYLKLFKAFVLGIFASLISAAFPAWEAASINPVEALRRSSLEKMIRSRLPLLVFVGSLLLIAGSITLSFPARELWISFSGLLLIVFGSATLVPVLTLVLMRLFSPFLSLVLGIIGKIASRNISRSLSRTSVSIASLMIAISVIIGVGTMVGSFRATVINWLANTIRADIYIRPTSVINPGIDNDIKVDLLSIDSIADIYNITTMKIESGKYNNSSIIVLDKDIAKRTWLWTRGNKGEQNHYFQMGWIFISEPFAWKHKINPEEDERLELMTDHGLREFKIAGVFRDFTSDQGIVLMSDKTYRQYWNDRKLLGVSVRLKKDANVKASIDKIQKRLQHKHDVMIISNRDLRNAAVEVFDRTFTITIALQILAGLVAFIGILNTVMSLMLERSKELGILRATGMTIGQLWRMILLESGLIGLSAGFFAIPLGTAMAWILVFIINKRSFGWTLDFIIQPQVYWQAITISIGAALLAGIYPAIKTSSTEVSELLRTE